MFLTTFGSAAFCLSLTVCRRVSRSNRPSPVVGAWLVRCPEAPFPYHMFVFHADGIMQQANPDAGDPNTSDSNGMGAWLMDGDMVKGKFVEITADRTTHKFVSRGEISFAIKVSGDIFRGTASASFYDHKGARIRGPLSASLEGQRVIP
jgi:hypothetical protein